MSDVDKLSLRARMRATRDAYAAAGPPAIVAPDWLLAEFRPGIVVASYMPVAGEADPRRIVEKARPRGCIIALPVVTGRAEPMRFLAWDGATPLVPGPFGLLQPGEGDQVAPDIVLTPLVAFDARLNRVGQGAGYYDRAFATLPHARRIGIAWSVQQIDAIAVDPWDVPLHAVITETGWITL